MKKILYLGFLGLIMIGCTKENLKDQPQTIDQADPSMVTMYVLNLDGETPSYDEVTISAKELGNNVSGAEKSNPNSAHTHGEFTGFGGGVTIEFSGTQNNGGSHGSGVFKQALGPFNLVIEMETACVGVDGDVAAYAGTFTDVEGSPFPPNFGPFALGNTVLFYVKDNGQSANAPLSQYSTALVIFGGFGGAFDCENIDLTQDFMWADVEGDDDKIKVN